MEVVTKFDFVREVGELLKTVPFALHNEYISHIVTVFGDRIYGEFEVDKMRQESFDAGYGEGLLDSRNGTERIK